MRNESNSDSVVEQQRTTIQLVTAITRQSPGRITTAIDAIVPGILKAAAREDDELREYALQSLEVFVLRCPGEITAFLGQIVQTGTKLIKYDPNYAGADEDEDEEMADAGEEDEDEDDWEDLWVVSGGSDSALRKWDVKTGRVLDRMSTDKAKSDRTLIWTVGVLA